MDLFTEDDLRDLVSIHYPNCVSIYMPSFRTGSETQQNPVRFKNLIAETEKRLTSQGMRGVEAAALLSPARRILKNGSFWQHQAEGLSAFIAPGILKIFRLPTTFHQTVIIGPHFHLKPLLPLLTGNTRFYLLDLNIKNVRFFTGARFMFSRINSEKIPLSLEETLQFDIQEGQQQFASKPQMQAGNQTTVFGYGRQTDKEKVNILNFFHRVNDAISDLLKNSNAPLVLAGVENLHPIYKKANTYPYLIEDGLKIDIHHLTDEQIHESVWPILENFFSRRKNKDTAFYKRLNGEHSHLAANDLKTIVAGSIHGRINTLFVTNGQSRLWGKFIESNEEIEVHNGEMPGDEDLLDKAAINTMLRGGIVYIVDPEDMPDKTPAAAILRY